MNIKKNYEELVNFLTTNKNKKVETLLDEIYLMCESKVKSTTYKKDEDNNIIAIFCYYHKEWEMLSEVEYGSKSSSTTGFNTMCKKGVRAWTKTQVELKKIDAKLLDMITNNEVEISELKQVKQDMIHTTKQKIFDDSQHDSNLYHSESEFE